MTQEAVREAIESARPEKYVPYGFAVRPAGVYRLDDSGDIAVCDPLHIEALARDGSGNNWGRVLVWRDPDGKAHEWAMPNNMLASDGAEYRRFLLDSGLGIRGGRKAQNALHDYIMTANPPGRAVSVNLPGWHGKRYIAVDGTAYGQGSDRLLLQASGALPRLDQKGTLESWRDNVAAYARGNSRLIFSISSAFAGSLLYFANEGSGGFHFAGESSGGKTTALRVASSAWGLPLRSWRTTDNAAESWARFANDGFLAIDELGQVDGRAADQMAYMLGNGQTKGRANRDGTARDTTEFRLMFLSTGEIGLAERDWRRQEKSQSRSGRPYDRDSRRCRARHEAVRGIARIRKR
jgi:putative DNA primase/helicase